MKRSWEGLVRPLLEYGVEIWGSLKWNEAETLQRKMGRYILGHWYNSNNGVVMNELGWMPLKDRRDMLRLRYWRKLLNMDNRRKVKQVYEADRKSSKKVWAEYTKELLYSLDLAKEWDTQHIEGSELQWNELLLEKFRERGSNKR